MKKVLLVASVALIATAAQAAGVYAEVGYSGTSTKQSATAFDAKFQSPAVRAVVGYDVNDFLAVEALGLMSAGSGKALNINGIDQPDSSSKLHNVLGIYLAPKYNVTPQLQVFARVGYAQARVTNAFTVNNTTVNEDITAKGASYGVGASYAITKEIYASVDYMSYANKNTTYPTGRSIKADSTAWNVGVGYRF